MPPQAEVRLRSPLALTTRRRALLWLSLLAAVVSLVSLASQKTRWNANPGFGMSPTGTPFIYEVTDVDGPGLRSGLRVGDQIDTRGDAFIFQGSIWQTGQPVHFKARRGPETVSVTLVPSQGPLTWDFLARFFIAFWTLGFAVLITLRSAKNKGNTLLAGALIAIVIQSGLRRTSYPSWILSVGANLVWEFVWVLAIALLAFYAAKYAPPSRTRTALLWATLLSAAIGLAIGWAQAIFKATPWVDVGTGMLKLQGWAPFAAGTDQWPWIPCLLLGLLAFSTSTGGERQRLGWVFGPFALLVFLVNFTSLGAGPLENVALLLVPLGLTYAATSRRLFDLEFVLNRAAIFTGVSFVVVGLFTLAEGALGSWLHNANKVTNVAVSAALALALGLSIHPIHTRVDRFVDTVFFRKRHEDEEALHKFAHEAAFMTDSDLILERAKNTLERHTEASSVSFAIYDGIDRYGGIGENDPALVTLRASHEVVDLHGVDTALHGEFAYPMLARGRLVGALVLGPKPSGESYAPDESRAIAQVAHGVGVALDLLDLQGDKPKEVLASVLDANQAIINEVKELRKAVQALSETVDERTREKTPL